MILIEIVLEDGNAFTTRFNGTLEEARTYYMSEPLNVGTVEDQLVEVEDVLQIRYVVAAEIRESGFEMRLGLFDLPEQANEGCMKAAGVYEDIGLEKIVDTYIRPYNEQTDHDWFFGDLAKRENEDYSLLVKEPVKNGGNENGSVL